MNGRKILVLAIGLLAIAGPASGQSYAIDWYTIGGGGGASSGGEFAISGTIGQPDAAPQPMTGGDFSLTGGFWSIIAVQTTNAPLLSVDRQGPSVRVFWELPAAGFVLEQSPAITGAWSQVPFPYNTNLNSVSITIPTPAANKFYRLRKL